MGKMKISECEIEECKKILKDELKKDISSIIKKLEKNKKKIIKHSKRAKKICDEIYEELDESIKEKIDKDLLSKAAIFHDIAKIEDDDTHNKLAKSRLKKHFKKSDEDFKKVCSIIKAHKGEFEPDENIALEAAILRMADKIDKWNKINFKQKKSRKDLEKCKKKYKENLEEIKERFKAIYNEEKGKKEFEKLKEACDRVKEKYENKCNFK